MAHYRNCILLIEPVWNRNLTAIVNTRCLWLLIEPVWNRNTSIALPINSSNVTFNRTSMESKRSSALTAAWISALLIEPVWNRNFKLRAGRKLIARLLIEPVWNRNVYIVTSHANAKKNF